MEESKRAGVDPLGMRPSKITVEAVELAADLGLAAEAVALVDALGLADNAVVASASTVNDLKSDIYMMI